MKRPLLCFSGLFAVGIFVSEKTEFSRIPKPAMIGCLVLLVLLFLLSNRWERVKKPGQWICVPLAGLLCGSLFFQTYTQLFVQPLWKLDGWTMPVTATVLDYPEIYEDSIQAEISIDESMSEKIYRDFKTSIYLPEEYGDLKPGDRLFFACKFQQSGIYDGFDKKSYQASKGIYILASCSNTEKIQRENAEKLPVWAYPKKAARQIQQSAEKLYEEREGGFLLSLLLGDKSGMETEDYIALKKAGIVHITAVSGMHVGFLVGFLLLLFGRRKGSILSVLLVCFFVFVAGASPSVVRAAVMYTLMAAAGWIHREADSLNSMFFALLLILLWNPYALFGLSLQLSFAATAGILLFYNRIFGLLPGKRKIKNSLVRKGIRYLKQTAACTAGSMIFTTPILMMAFDYLSIVSVVTNLLVLPVVSLAFVLGYLSCIAGIFWLGAGKVLAFLVRPLLYYILGISTGISHFSYAIVFADGGICYIILAVMYGLLLAGYIFRRWIRPGFVLLGILILWLGAGACGVLRSGQAKGVTILPSGYGQTIVVSGEEGRLALIDCSGSGYRDSTEMVKEWMLLHNGEKIEVLVLTAVDTSHAKAVPDLLGEVPVGHIVMPEESKDKELAAEIEKAAEERNVSVTYCGETSRTELNYPDFSMEIYGDIERKTVVRVSDLLIVQSLTQNMLADFLEKRPTQAEQITLAASNMTDYEKLNGALQILQPSCILLESGYSFSDSIEGIPVYNTFTEGQIEIQD